MAPVTTYSSRRRTILVFFDRGGRSVVLNTAGRRALPQIEDLVRRYEALIDFGEPDELSGTVVMGALVSALMGSFADALWNLKEKHPRLEVQLFGGLSNEFAYKVEHGELDAGRSRRGRCHRTWCGHRSTRSRWC